MSTAALTDSAAGTHQHLKLIPSVLRTSTSSYSSPTEAGVAHGDLRFGPVIHRTTSNPTPRYPTDMAGRITSMRRSIVPRTPRPDARGLSLRLWNRHPLRARR